MGVLTVNNTARRASTELHNKILTSWPKIFKTCHDFPVFTLQQALFCFQQKLGVKIKLAADTDMYKISGQQKDSESMIFAYSM
jgi:hypothetical protein